VKIAIIGYGIFGSSLGKLLLSNKHSIYAFSKTPIKTQKNLFILKDLEEIKKNKFDYVLFATTSDVTVSLFKKVTDLLTNKPIIIICSKGLNNMKTVNKTIDQINHKYDVCYLSGPSFANEIIEKKPTFVNILTTNSKVFNSVDKLFKTSYFHLEQCKDVTGGLFLGAIKNVYAIYSGYIKAKFNSCNYAAANFALIINELLTIFKMYKYDMSTVLQYCGIGDLFLTCSSEKSRNFTFGQKIAEFGFKKAYKMNEMTIEGYSAFLDFKKMFGEKIKKFKILNELNNILK